ncbi:MAG TPA: hypothetical protein VGP39_06455 [Bradyrhizobium sp.]|nr:hypothetical protein [Bradyrhizobium sp.]
MDGIARQLTNADAKTHDLPNMVYAPFNPRSGLFSLRCRFEIMRPLRFVIALTGQIAPCLSHLQQTRFIAGV